MLLLNPTAVSQLFYHILADYHGKNFSLQEVILEGEFTTLPVEEIICGCYLSIER
jgi:hypothetical protein